MTLEYITLLLIYQLIGEVAAKALDHAAGIPLPGPVVGMALLFLTLLIRGRAPEGLNHTAQGLLTHLSLLFVPAGVGVMMHLHLVGEEWQAISAALVGSTVLTIMVTAWIMVGLNRLSGGNSEPPAGDAPTDSGPEENDHG